MTTPQSQDSPLLTITSITLNDSTCVVDVHESNDQNDSSKQLLSTVVCAPVAEPPSATEEFAYPDELRSESSDSDWTSVSDSDTISESKLFVQGKRTYKSSYWTPQEISGFEGMNVKSPGRFAQDFFGFSPDKYKSGLGVNPDTGDHFVTIATMVGTGILHLSQLMIDGLVPDVNVFKDHNIRHLIGWSDKTRCYCIADLSVPIDGYPFLPRKHTPELLAFIGWCCAKYPFTEIESNTSNLSFGDRFMALYNLLDFGSECAASFVVAEFVTLRSRYNLRFKDPGEFLSSFAKCTEILNIPILAFSRFERAAKIRAVEHKTRRLNKIHTGPFKTKLVFGVCLRGLLSALSLLPMTVEAGEVDDFKFIDQSGPYLFNSCWPIFFLYGAVIWLLTVSDDPRRSVYDFKARRTVVYFCAILVMAFCVPNLVVASPVNVPLACPSGMCPIESNNKAVKYTGLLAFLFGFLFSYSPELLGYFQTAFAHYNTVKPKKKKLSRHYSDDDIKPKETPTYYPYMGHTPDNPMPEPKHYHGHSSDADDESENPLARYKGQSAELAAVELNATLQYEAMKGQSLTTMSVIGSCVALLPFLADGLFSCTTLQGLRVIGMLLTGPTESAENPKWKCRAHLAFTMSKVLEQIHKLSIGFVTSELVSLGIDFSKLTFRGQDDSGSTTYPTSIEQLKTLMTSGKTILNSALAQQVSTLVTFCALYPMLVSDVSELTVQGFDMEKNFYRTRSKLIKDGCGLEQIMDTVIYWVEFCSVWLATKSVRTALAAVEIDDNDEWLECLEMDKMIHTGSYVDKGFTLQTIKYKYLRLLKKYRQKGAPAKLEALRMSRSEKLKIMIIDLDCKSQFGAAKEQCLPFTFCGPAGCAKSSTVPSVMVVLHKRYGIDDIMKVDHIVDGSKYDDQLDAATTGAIWDDAGNIRADKRKEPLQSTLLRHVSVVTTPLIKADLKEKGVCVSQVKFFGISTNDPGLGVGFETVEPNSGLRRMGVHIEFVTRPEFLDPDTHRLDPTKVDITKTVVFPYFNTYNRFFLHYDSKTQKTVHIKCRDNMDHMEVLEDFLLLADAHFEAQKKAMSRVRIAAAIELCSCELRTVSGCCRFCDVKVDLDWEIPPLKPPHQGIAVGHSGIVDATTATPLMAEPRPEDVVNADFFTSRMVIADVDEPLPANETWQDYIRFQYTLAYITVYSYFTSFTRASFYNALLSWSLPCVRRIVANDYNAFRVWMTFDWLIDTIPLIGRLLIVGTHRRYAKFIRYHLVASLVVVASIRGLPNACIVGPNFLSALLVGYFCFSTVLIIAVEVYMLLYTLNGRINRRRAISSYLSMCQSDKTILTIGLAVALAGGTALKFRRAIKTWFVQTYVGQDSVISDGIPVIPTLIEKKERIATDVVPNRWEPCHRLPPTISASSVGMTDDQLKNKVLHNSYKFRGATPEGVQKRTSILAIDSHSILMPAHVWCKPRTNPDDPIEFYKSLTGTAVQYTNLGDPLVKVITLVYDNCSVIPNRDIVVCPCDLRGTQSNLINYFLVGEFQGSLAVNMYKRNDEGAPVGPIALNASREKCSYDISCGGVSIDGMKYRASDHFMAGDCMSPVISVGGGSAIVGLHIAGAGAFGIATFPLRPELVTALEELRERGLYMLPLEITCVKSRVADKIVPLNDEPHSKSPAVHMVPDINVNIEFLKETERKFSASSNLVMNPTANSVKEKFNMGDIFAKPNMNYNRSVYKPIALTSSDMPAVDENLARWAKEDYCEPIQELLYAHPEFKLQPLTVREALNGVVGMKYLGGIKSSTSAGFPLNCKKSNYLEGEPGDWTLAPKMHQELLECMSDVIDGKHPGVPNECFLKDEPRPPEKAETARSVFGTPFMSLLQMMMVFGPAMNFVISFPEVFGHAMGVDCGSPEFGLRLTNFVNNSDLDCGVNSDFSTFDQSISPIWKRMLWLVFKDIFEAMDYDTNYINYAERLFGEIVYCLVNWGGSILVNANLWPSGTYITACGGSIMTNLFYRYSMKKHNPNLQCFRSVMTIMGLGDDNCGAKRKGADVGEWNMLKMRDDMSEIGMQVTPAEKLSGFKEWYSVKNLEFLQRMMFYNIDLGHAVMILKPPSCMRGWIMYSPTKGLAYRDHMHDISRSTMEEWFLYGRAPYEYVREQLSDIASEAGWGIFECLEMPYDEKVKAHKARYGNYTAQECPVGMSTVSLWPLPWECKGQSGGDEEEAQVTTTGISKLVEPEIVVGGTVTRWDPSMKLDISAPASMANYLGREVPIAAIEIGIGEAISVSLDPFAAYLDNEVINPRIKGYTELQAGIEVRFALSGSPMHSGILMASYLHDPLHNDYTKDENVNQFIVMAQRSMTPHVLITIGDEASSYLNIPFIHRHASFSLKEKEYRSKVSLYIDTVTELFHAQGVLDKVVLNVYAKLTNVVLVGAANLYGQSENVIGEPPSTKLSTMSRIAHNASLLFASVPNLALPFEVASVVLDGVVGVARDYGYSRPAIVGSTMTIPSVGPSLCNTNIDLPIKSLSMDANQATSIDGTCFGGKVSDELSMDPFLSKPVIVGIATVSSLDEPGTLICSMPVTPHVAVEAGIHFFPTPSGFIAKNFKYYRGDITYTFKISTPMSTGGQFIVYASPHKLDNPTVTTTQNMQIDIRTTKEFSVTVRWNRSDAFLETGSYGPFTTMNGLYHSQFHNGQWGLYVLNKLAAVGATPAEAKIVVTMQVDTRMIFMDHSLTVSPPNLRILGEPTDPVTRELPYVPNKWHVTSTRLLTSDGTPTATDGSLPTSAPNVGPFPQPSNPIKQPSAAPVAKTGQPVVKSGAPVAKTTAPVLKTSAPVKKPTFAPIYKPTSFPTFAPTSICHSVLTLTPISCVTSDKGIINAPNTPTPPYSYYYQGPDQDVTVRVPCYSDGIKDSMVKLNFDSSTKVIMQEATGRSMVGNTMFQVIPKTSSPSQGIVTIVFTAKATLFLLSTEVSMPSNGQWDVVYSGDSRWVNGTVTDTVVNSSNQLFYSRFHNNNTTYMVATGVVTPGCVSSVPFYVMSQGYLRSFGVLVQNTTYPTVVATTVSSVGYTDVSLNTGAGATVNVQCMTIWKTNPVGQSGDYNLTVGKPTDYEAVCRVHSGECVTSIRPLLKILRPSFEYVSDGTDVAFETDHYAHRHLPIYHPQRFTPLCFGCERGGMISHYSAIGDGRIEALRKAPAGQHDYQRGYEFTDTRVNPTLVIQYPCYNNERYVIPRAITSQAIGKKLLVLRPTTPMVVLEDTSIAEDYMLSNFIGCPILTYT